MTDCGSVASITSVSVQLVYVVGNFAEAKSAGSWILDQCPAAEDVIYVQCCQGICPLWWLDVQGDPLFIIT